MSSILPSSSFPSQSSPLPDLYVVLGAGVIGLSTAITLKQRLSNAHIIIVAKNLPGDAAIDYTSPWAGANWLSTATDNGRQESWDAVTYKKFSEIVDNVPEAGVIRCELQALFDSEKEDSGVLSQGTGRIWYDSLVRGIKYLEGEELKGAKWGMELPSFVVDVGTYLPWLLITALKMGVEVRRGVYENIKDLFGDYTDAKAFLNCTGIGSYHLKGVEDHSLYPTLGQVMLVESPKVPLKRMYFRSPARTHADTTYVFPRGNYETGGHGSGGLILGGCRMDGAWSQEGKDGIDLNFAEDIKRRCCALTPELGKPEDLKVLRHGVGLRPSRKGGARIEKEIIADRIVVHNYGAGGAGYQASWGMAKEAVDILLENAHL